MSSSLVWSVGALALSSLVSPAAAAAKESYQLLENWHGDTFWDGWDFFDASDPTNGFVTYTNQSHAEDTGLIDITSRGSLYMGVDHKSKLDPSGPGRESVRIETKGFYKEGLYVLDLEHMPGSICGTWPAFWSVGPSWPEDGEIDIIEGVNKHDSNKIVLHTSGSCDVEGGNEMLGEMSSGECGEASGTIGCVVKGNKGSSGDPFNKQGGGVYAMEWTDTFIKIWYFPRDSIPPSITDGHPDSSTFPTPMAHLQGSCDIAARFKPQKFILDTTFCGDWSGNVYGDSSCPISDSSNPMQSCVDYVAENPEAFKDAYWEINSIKLYQYGVPKPSTNEVSATTSAVSKTSVSVSDSAVSTPDSVSVTTSVSVSDHGPDSTATHTSEATEKTHTESAHAPPTSATETSTVVPETTAPPAPKETPKETPTAAPVAPPADQGAHAPASKSTRFVTETTTYCPEEASSAAAGGETGAVPIPAPSHGADVPPSDDSSDNGVNVVPVHPPNDEPEPAPAVPDDSSDNGVNVVPVHPPNDEPEPSPADPAVPAGDSDATGQDSAQSGSAASPPSPPSKAQDPEAVGVPAQPAPPADEPSDPAVPSGADAVGGSSHPTNAAPLPSIEVSSSSRFLFATPTSAVQGSSSTPSGSTNPSATTPGTAMFTSAADKLSMRTPTILFACIMGLLV